MNDRASQAVSAEELLQTLARLQRNEQDLQLLQRLAVELVVEENPQAIYEAIVDAATRLMKSQFASMQMVVPGESPRRLKLLASRGFDDAAVLAWDIVTPSSRSSCSVAMGKGARAVIPDFEKADPESLDIAAYLRAGIRAAQSTPLVSRSGVLVGMISTHWSHPHQPSDSELRNFDILARQCADLLERRRTEAQIRESEARFRAFVTTSADMVYRMSPDWSEMKHLDGQSFIADQLEPSQNWLDRYIHPEDRALVTRTIAQAIRTGSMFELEHRVVRADGTTGWTHSRAIPIFGDDGGIVEWFGAASDVTRRKAAEQALVDADRRKDEFLAILAHELRNPLAPVRTAAELLKHAPSEKEAAAARDIIDRQVAGLTRLIDDLMDISRISQGKIHLRKESVSLGGAILNAVEATRPLMEAARQSLALTLSPEPLHVHGDPARLVQVFTNLLNNASKYSPDGSRIELSVAVEEGAAAVRVRDYGVGVPKEELEKIWEMFVQSDHSLERRHGGLGIGLTLVRSLVHLHGGTVSASSEGPSQGSTFCVRLPLGPRAVASEKQAAAPAAKVPRLRILVADDNIDAAASLGMLLKLSGCEVETAHDGEAAFDVARRFKPDVALLDIGMPKLNGYELAKRIKRESWGRVMTLVAVTGWGQEHDRKRSGDAGFDRHLVKPVDTETLRTLLLVRAAAT